MNLYIKFKTTTCDEKHQFEETVSGIFNCKEYVWTGYLRRGLVFHFEDENGNVIPSGLENSGLTTDTELTNLLVEVKNALVVKDGNNVYNYMNSDSAITYNGKWGKVTLYVRVYDNADGYDNNRWIALNTQK